MLASPFDASCYKYKMSC
uniref:Uncharacterized protein n=1 Tax=Arundo donax TaxID=35708 RepID=A0A0A9G1C7_ARUDO